MVDFKALFFVCSLAFSSAAESPSKSLQFEEVPRALDLYTIGDSACDNLLEQQCPKWKLHCRDEKWNSPQPGSHILYANPAECQTFLGSGELTVTEFIRTHNSLASKGYVNWTDPQFHGTLTRTVGQRFFHHMANLNLGYLNDLVTASRKEKIQYLDYSTECKLRRLLDKEERDSWAREQLRRHREFYKKWEKELFSDHVFEVPTLTPAIGQSLEATTTMSLQSSGWLLRWNLYAVVSGIISCIIIH